MMKLKERISAFAELGLRLRNALPGPDKKGDQQLSELINNQQYKNAWFTPTNVTSAIEALANELTPENLSRWTEMYPGLTRESPPHTVGIIMAGNIPLVGFHDFLCVLITGNRLLAKTSSKDSELIVYIAELLYSINTGFNDMIRFTDGTLSGFDAVIATGSNNSSRYFEYYFSRYPNIIRKNRNSIAILKGDESEKDIQELGNDVFSYFGLGCRNVSKIFIPDNYNLNKLLKQWGKFSGVIQNNKYANNYDYNKAVYLVNKYKFFDSGHLLLKEEKGLSSPVSVLYYEYYNSYNSIMQHIEEMKDKIQCIVGSGNIPFGESQQPKLWDYADGTDTIDFLLKKKHRNNVI
ncbi:MAG TPA: acyl-CoA reductase [Bacteroidales bacterium]|nr:acyl-CoA reductase [Bacteroidales bacterium]